MKARSERGPWPAPAPRQGDDGGAGRRWLRLGVLVVIVLGVHAIGGWLVDRLWFEVWPRHSPMLDVAALGITFAYIATMALPFVPGIEIGLVVMLAFGHSAIPAVYLATQCALLLSFLAGRLLSPTALIRLAAWLHLHGTRDLLLRLAPMEPADRIGYMLARAPYQWVGRLVRHRYISLAVLINLPGNAILGGAGGIGLLAGMSGIIKLPRYMATMAIATTPVPLLLWFGGMG